jgi:phage-related holin
MQESLNKLVLLLKKPFIYFISLVTTYFNMAADEGIVAKLSIMFLIITFLPWFDFFFAVVGSVLKGYAIRSHKIGKTFLKFVAAYGVFFALSFFLVLTNGVDKTVAFAIYYATWLFTIIFAVRELISMFETADKLGVPIPSVVKRIINGIPEKIENQYKQGLKDDIQNEDK